MTSSFLSQSTRTWLNKRPETKAERITHTMGFAMHTPPGCVSFVPLTVAFLSQLVRSTAFATEGYGNVGVWRSFSAVAFGLGHGAGGGGGGGGSCGGGCS